MYGSIYDLGMAHYPTRRVALALRTPGWDSTPSGAVSTRVTTVFDPGLLELYMNGKISDPEMAP